MALPRSGATPTQVDAIVIGAGLAGLAAAVDLRAAGQEVLVLEASDGPGGRVRTDLVDGYRLDRGFQILLTAYPELQARFAGDDLELCRFEPGALIHLDQGFTHLSDPLRRPGAMVETLRSPVGSLFDKAKILKFRWASGRGSLEELFCSPDTTGRQRLRDAGFSDGFVNRFLLPLFAGITLEPGLQGSSRVVEFVFRMLATGDSAVPAQGMGRLSEVLADRLPPGAIRYRTPVAEVDKHAVRLADGERLEADTIIVATDMSTASKLVGTPDRGWNAVTSVWFTAPEPPVKGPLLVLSGHGVSPVDSMAVMSEVSREYAPPGRSLIVASTPYRDVSVTEQQGELRRWFGPQVGDWEVLRVDEILHAQPRQPPGWDARASLRVRNGIYVTGDHRRDASINGALQAGREVVELILEHARGGWPDRLASVRARRGLGR